MLVWDTPLHCRHLKRRIPLSQPVPSASLDHSSHSYGSTMSSRRSKSGNRRNSSGKTSSRRSRSLSSSDSDESSPPAESSSRSRKRLKKRGRSERPQSSGPDGRASEAAGTTNGDHQSGRPEARYSGFRGWRSKSLVKNKTRKSKGGEEEESELVATDTEELPDPT